MVRTLAKLLFGTTSWLLRSRNFLSVRLVKASMPSSSVPVHKCHCTEPRATQAQKWHLTAAGGQCRPQPSCTWLQHFRAPDGRKGSQLRGAEGVGRDQRIILYGHTTAKAGSDGGHVRLTCGTIVIPFSLGRCFLQTIICLQKDACGIESLLVAA